MLFVGKFRLNQEIESFLNKYFLSLVIDQKRCYE